MLEQLTLFLHCSFMQGTSVLRLKAFLCVLTSLSVPSGLGKEEREEIQ